MDLTDTYEVSTEHFYLLKQIRLYSVRGGCREGNRSSRGGGRGRSELIGGPRGQDKPKDGFRIQDNFFGCNRCRKEGHFKQESQSYCMQRG